MYRESLEHYAEIEKWQERKFFRSCAMYRRNLLDFAEPAWPPWTHGPTPHGVRSESRVLLCVVTSSRHTPLERRVDGYGGLVGVQL